MEERVGIMHRILWAGLEVVPSASTHILSARAHLTVRGLENRLSCVPLAREEKHRSANTGILCTVHLPGHRRSVCSLLFTYKT